MDSSDREIRVMGFEDNPLVAQAIGRVVSGTAGLRWLGSVTSKAQLERAFEFELPHVLLMDLDIPGEDTCSIIANLSRRFPSVRVIVVTAHTRQEYVDQVVDSGAWGFLSKAEESAVLTEAVRQVHAGEFVLTRRTHDQCKPTTSSDQVQIRRHHPAETPRDGGAKS